MNRLSTSLLLVGIALAMAVLCFRPAETISPEVSEKKPDVEAPKSPASELRGLFKTPALSKSALAKLDPVLIERLKSPRVSENSRWNAMLVLSLPSDLQEALANAFDQNSESSSSHSFHDSSPTRAATESAIEIANAKRKQALELQAEILSDFTDSFLASHPGLREHDVESKFGLAPMISIKASPEQILALAESDAVHHIGADIPAEKAIERIAMEARFSHAWNSDFLNGSGVKVALLEENDVPFSYLLGAGRAIKSPVAIYDPDAVDENEHSSNTAAVIWGQDPFFRGLAHGSTPYFATAKTTTGRAAATDWCIQQGCSVISMSWGSPAQENNGNLKWIDLYYDWVTEINRVFVVAAAGNDGNAAGRVIHPGAAFNVLTVGALDGKNPNFWGDDVVASYSSHVDPNTGAMKPEVVSYGTNIKAAGVAPAFSTLTSGTSYATPAVASAAALCIQENPDSADEPMLLKAQLMASAVSHDLAGTNRDGVGTVLAQAYNAATSARTINRTGTDGLEWNITLDGGRKNRVVLCYPHRPNTAGAPNSGTAVDNHNSYHEIDLDLELWVGGTKVAQSDFGINNPFEVIDYTPATTTAATVRIVNFDWKSGDPRDSIRVGLAAGSNLNFGTGPDDSNDDSFEPNDSEGETKLLSLDANLTDMRSTDEDWFRLEIPPHTTTTVRIDFDNDIGDLDLAAHRTDDASATVTSISERDFEEVTLPPSTAPKTWRVRVFPYNQTADRTSYTLQVLSDLPPGEPTPISPIGGTQTGVTPTFSCSSPSPYPEDSNVRPHGSSRWQISETSAFSSVLVDETNSNQTTYQVPSGILAEGRQYFWRVRHVDQDSRPGLWSTAAAFVTVSADVFPGTTLEGIQQEWIGNDLEISWNPVPNADGYRIYKIGSSTNTPGDLVAEFANTEFLVKNMVAGDQLSYWIAATKGDAENQGTTVNIAAPAPKVDGLIGTKANRLRGNNRYSANGSGQRIITPFSITGRTTLYFAGENESQIQSHLLFRSIYRKRHLKARIKTLDPSSRNVSAELATNGYLAPAVPSLSLALFKARVIAKRRTGPRQHKLRIIQSALTSSRVPLFSDTTLSVLRKR